MSTIRLSAEPSSQDGQAGVGPTAPVVGVRTTRIYCRPVCRPARMPRPENCVPFPDAEVARAAGYRPCKLCRPDDATPPPRLVARPEEVRFGTGPTPLGTAFAARTDVGVCALFFPEAETGSPALDRLRTMFPGGRIAGDDVAVAPLLASVAAWLEGGPEPAEVPLDLRGTPFQLEVWRALRSIPAGETCSYGELARRLGRPSASRAVGAACGANPVAILVPCHRAVGSRGDLVNYRWGLERKRALLGRESRGEGAELALFSR